MNVFFFHSWKINRGFEMFIYILFLLYIYIDLIILLDSLAALNYTCASFIHCLTNVYRVTTRSKKKNVEYAEMHSEEKITSKLWHNKKNSREKNLCISI